MALVVVDPRSQGRRRELERSASSVRRAAAELRHGMDRSAGDLRVDRQPQGLLERSALLGIDLHEAERRRIGRRRRQVAMQHQFEHQRGDGRDDSRVDHAELAWSRGMRRPEQWRDLSNDDPHRLRERHAVAVEIEVPGAPRGLQGDGASAEVVAQLGDQRAGLACDAADASERHGALGRGDRFREPSRSVGLRQGFVAYVAARHASAFVINHYQYLCSLFEHELECLRLLQIAQGRETHLQSAIEALFLHNF